MFLLGYAYSLSYYNFQVIDKMMGRLDKVSINSAMELNAAAAALGSVTSDADDLSEDAQVHSHIHFSFA